MYISKLDAAKRQLDTAIRLYFFSQDPVSIHTLVGASHTVLRDVCNYEGDKQVIMEKIIEYIDIGVKEEHRQGFKEKLFEARNFFKHARTDAKDNVEFSAEQTDWFTRDCIMMYQQLTTHITVDMRLFDVWFKMKHRGLFPTHSEIIKNIIQQSQELNLGNKMQFYTFMKPVFEQQSSGVPIKDIKF